MVKKKENNKSLYIDVTNEWLAEATPNSYDILIDKEFIDDKNVRHPIKGIEKVHPASKNSDEYMIATILKETLGGEIHMVPRITNMANSHLGVKTPDYIWNNEKWDLKTPIFKNNYNNLMNDLFKKKYLKLQSEKFIIDLVNYSNISEEEISHISIRMFRNKYRHWIKGLIIIKNSKINKVFIKKEPSSSDNIGCSARSS